MRRYIYSILWCVALLGVASVAKAQSNVVDEVIWVVGDEAILKSFNARLKQVNKAFPVYSQVNAFELVENEFKKTPKKSIKRFL